MADELAARVAAALDGLAGEARLLGVALSGGGDSTALLRLAHGWARARGRRLIAATVDHRLRPESRAEAETAGRTAAALGVPHAVLTWREAPGATGNLAARAREARRALLAGWAAQAGAAAVLLGHTRDDLAETLLMRLDRGAGLEGLAGMAARHEAGGILWLRPLLGTGRAELRGWLTARGLGWVEDPGNEDPARDRPRMRRAIALTPLDAARLAESARQLGEARAALGALVWRAAQGVEAADGALTLPLAAVDELPPEARRLLLVALAACVTGCGYPPRRAAQRQALAALESGRRTVLGGALLWPAAGRLIAAREPAAAARAPALAADGLWDGRWRVTGLPPGHRLAALGPGISPLGPGPRGPAALLAGLPALWRGATLVAVPGHTPAPPGFAATPLADAAALRRRLTEGPGAFAARD